MYKSNICYSVRMVSRYCSNPSIEDRYKAYIQVTKENKKLYMTLIRYWLSIRCRFKEIHIKICSYIWWNGNNIKGSYWSRFLIGLGVIAKTANPIMYCDFLIGLGVTAKTANPILYCYISEAKSTQLRLTANIINTWMTHLQLAIILM